MKNLSPGPLGWGLTALLCCSTHAWASFPSVAGSVYLDVDASGTPSAGEGVQGVPVQLYLDDGDGAFDMSTDAVVSSGVTDDDGHYHFDTPLAHDNYFVLQEEHTMDSITLPSSVSSLLTPVAFNRVIDDFSDQQVTNANPVVPVDQSNLTGEASIGGQRDLHLQYLTGPAESTLRSNPYGLNEVLEFDQSAGVISIATVTWDGIDSDLSLIPAVGGLGGLDFTADGSDAFGFTLGVDAAGANEKLTLRVYTGTEVSTATIDLTVTDGTAEVFQLVPFEDFQGTASFTHVDAVQLVIGGTSPSVDAQVGPIGLVGPVTHDISISNIPEPSAALLGLAAIGWVCHGFRRRGAGRVSRS